MSSPLAPTPAAPRRCRLRLEPLEPRLLLSNFYVSATDGSDHGDGTRTDPWRTIENALEENWLEGSESDPVNIHVAAGTYDGALVLNCLSRHTNLYGGYNPDVATGDWSDRNPYDRTEGSPYRTVISGGTDDRGLEYHGPLLIGTEALFSGFVVADCDASYGAAIMLFNVELTIEHCSFENNVSPDRGGAIYSDTPVVIRDSLFLGNAAGEKGGAIYSGDTLAVTNTVFLGNSADGAGGGIYSSDTLTLTHCTFAGNSAGSGGGGGLANSDDAEIVNSIFWGNTTSASGRDDEIYTSPGDSTSVAYSIVEGADADDWDALNPRFTADHVEDSDPLFVADDDLHLQAASPAIDLADPGAGVDHDLDGEARPAADGPDAGAYEYQGAPIDSGPWVAAIDPTGTTFLAVSHLDVTFGEPIDPATFTLDDVTLEGPAGPIAPTGLTPLGSDAYRITFPEQDALGDYALTIGTDVLDLDANPMNQDRDGENGEAGDDAFTGGFTIAVFDSGPAVTDLTPEGSTTGPLNFVDVTFDETLDPASFTTADVALAGPLGPVVIESVTPTGGNTFRITFAWQSALGTYDLTVGPAITDAAGNPMNQDGDFANGEAGADAFTGSFTIDANSVGLWLIATHTYADGVVVSLYDADLANGISAPTVAWGDALEEGTADVVIDPGEAGDGIVDRIRLNGNGAQTDDLGVVVENNAELRKLDDRRGRHADSLAFIASEGPIGSVAVNTDLAGGLIGGLVAPGGWTLPDDPDGDGDTDDATALWCPGDVRLVKVYGDVAGDIAIGGDLGYLRGYGALDADVAVAGALNKLYVSGSWSGSLTAERIGSARTKAELAASIATTAADERGVSIRLLQAGRVTDASVDVPGGILGIRVAEWQAGSIDADWVRLLQTKGSRSVAGDFAADLTLTGQTLDDGQPTLRYAKIAGQAAGGTWTIAGDARTVKLRSAAAGWTFDCSGHVRTLYAKAILSGTWTSASIRSLTVKGSIIGAEITLTQAPDADTLALGKAKVKYWMDGSLIAVAGDVGSVVVGGLRDSALLAGVAAPADANGDGVADLPDPATGFAAPASLRSLKVKGTAADPAGRSVVNSNVAAWTIGKATLTAVQTDNAGVVFGLAARELASLTLAQPDQTTAWADPQVTVVAGNFEARIA